VLRSGVSPEAVLEDSWEMLIEREARDAIRQLRCQGVFVRATRVLLNEEPPLYAEQRLADLRAGWPMITEVVTVPDTNHYTVILGERGAGEIARLVLKPLEPRPR
jgi:hypothetical protein